MPEQLPSRRAGGRTDRPLALWLADALFLPRDEVCKEVSLPAIRRVVEDVHRSQLPELGRDAGLPWWSPEADLNRATGLWRGVWFPFAGHRMRRP
jgi:hypothetical protein